MQSQALVLESHDRVAFPRDFLPEYDFTVQRSYSFTMRFKEFTAFFAPVSFWPAQWANVRGDAN